MTICYLLMIRKINDELLFAIKLQINIIICCCFIALTTLFKRTIFFLLEKNIESIDY